MGDSPTIGAVPGGLQVPKQQQLSVDSEPATPKKQINAGRWNVLRKRSVRSGQSATSFSSSSLAGISYQETPESASRKNAELSELLDEVTSLYNGSEFADVEPDYLPDRQINILSPLPPEDKTCRRVTDAPAPLCVSPSLQSLPKKKPAPLRQISTARPGEGDRLDSLVRTCSSLLNWPITPSQLSAESGRQHFGSSPGTSPKPLLLANFSSNRKPSTFSPRDEHPRFPRKKSVSSESQPRSEEDEDLERLRLLAAFLRNTSPVDDPRKLIAQLTPKNSVETLNEKLARGLRIRKTSVPHSDISSPSLGSSEGFFSSQGSPDPQSPSTGGTGFFSLRMAEKRSRAASDGTKSSKRSKASDPKVSKAKASDSKKGRKNSKSDEKKFSEENIFSAKSPLVNANLVEYFARPEAWDCLDDEDKAQIMSLFPPSMPYDEQGRPEFQYLRYNNDWRNAVREFQEHLRAGRYEPEWLEEAAQASAERANGDYDAWKEEQFEEYWGQKQKLNLKQFNGELNKITLEEMIGENLFDVGDVWVYIRPFGRGKNGFLVEKALTIIGICVDNKLVFSIPPGQRKYSGSMQSLPSVPESPASEARETTKAVVGASKKIDLAGVTDMTYHDPFNVHPGKPWKPEPLKINRKDKLTFSKDEMTPPEFAQQFAENEGVDAGMTGYGFEISNGAPWFPPKRNFGIPKLPTVTSSGSLNTLVAVIEQFPPPPPIEDHPAFRNGKTMVPNGNTFRPLPRELSPVRKPVGSPSSRQNSPFEDAGKAPLQARATPRPGSSASNRTVTATDVRNAASQPTPKPVGPRPIREKSSEPSVPAQHRRTPSTEPHTHTVSTLQELERRILDVDGRTNYKKATGGTEVLWKCFTVKKGAAARESISVTLWDVRKKYWLGKNPYVRVPKDQGDDKGKEKSAAQAEQRRRGSEGAEESAQALMSSSLFCRA